MCWAVGSNARAGVLLTCLFSAGAIAGCARPQGMLFKRPKVAKVWPPPPGPPRIKLVGALSGSGDLKAAQSSAEVFRAALRGPRPPIKFSGPHALAVHSPGLLAVADAAGAAVHVIDLDARTHRRIAGWNEERFGAPLGVTWAGERLFITDGRRHEVVELDVEGRYHRSFGSDVLKRPVGITYIPERDRLYVVDGGAHNLAVFDLAGAFIERLGEYGVGRGEFNFPTHICGSGGRLLVADSGNFRVQLLDLDGNCLRTIGQKGDGAGDFALPKGVAFDSEGHLYVVDARFENVQIFDAVGRLLMAFGEEGRELGEFWLPAGIAIDTEDRIWVADAGNRRIQVFAYMRAAS